MTPGWQATEATFVNQFVNVHVQRARAAIDMKRWELVLEETAKGFAEEPNAVVLHAMRAKALYHMRDYREAGETARVAISLDPEWYYPYYLLSWCILSDFFAGPDRLDAAKEVADAAMAVAPNEPGNHYLQAEIAYVSNQLAEGVKFALTGLALDPDDTSCLKALAKCQLQLEDYVAAEGTLRRLLTLDPESTFAHENLARALLGQSQYASAYEHARSAVRLEPNDADIRELYRETVRYQNRPARVLLWISKIWDNYPYFVVVIWLIPVVAFCGFSPAKDNLRGALVLVWSLVFMFHERIATTLAEWCIACSRQRHLLPDRRRYMLRDWVKLGIAGMILGLLVSMVVLCMVLVTDGR